MGGLTRNMMNISKMVLRIENKIDKEYIPKLIKAQRDTAKKVWEDIIETSPYKGGDYISSIKVEDTINNGGVIKTRITSDLMVDWERRKGGTITLPLAHFINWGTGPLGESTNIFPHGYPYTTDAPWNYATYLQNLLTGTWGRKANPHFYLSLQKNVGIYKENLKAVFK